MFRKDAVSSNVFKRISQRTGGQVFFARTWRKQVEAFESIRESLGNSYTVTYYPASEILNGELPQDQCGSGGRCGQEVSCAGEAGVSAGARILARGETTLLVWDRWVICHLLTLAFFG